MLYNLEEPLLRTLLQDMKMRMCLIAGIIILILVIVIPAGEYQQSTLPSR